MSAPAVAQRVVMLSQLVTLPQPPGRPADKHLVTRHADAAQLDRPGIEPGPAHTHPDGTNSAVGQCPPWSSRDQPPAPWGPDMVAEPGRPSASSGPPPRPLY